MYDRTVPSMPKLLQELQWLSELGSSGHQGLVPHCQAFIFIALQARFTDMILRQMAGIQFPEDRIFSQTVSGRPKSEVLEQLHTRHPGAPGYHFVEDKLSTLLKASGHVMLM